MVAALATCVEPVVLSVVQDEMLWRMRMQRWELGGVACSIEWVALAHGWGTDQLCEALALPVYGCIYPAHGIPLVRVA